MRVNSDAGKTDIFATGHGKESQLATQRFMLSQQRSVSAESPLYGHMTIGLINLYKHLDTVSAGPHRYKVEIGTRIAHSNKALMFSKHVFVANDGLPRTQISTVWKAIAISKLIYHCATWGQFTAECTAKITSAYHERLPIYERLAIL